MEQRKFLEELNVKDKVGGNEPFLWRAFLALCSAPSVSWKRQTQAEEVCYFVTLDFVLPSLLV